MLLYVIRKNNITAIMLQRKSFKGIDSQRPWTYYKQQHIEKAVTKANNVLFMLKRNSNVPVYTKLNLYKSMVLPILPYAFCIDLNSECMKMLESVEKTLPLDLS